MTDEIPTVNTSVAGLDALADELAVEWQLTREDRDQLRVKLAEIEGVVWEPKLGRLMRIKEHERVGDWLRVTFEPFLRLIPNRPN